MPYSFTLPDGTTIEAVQSDAHTGPDRECGQRCGSAIWWRRAGEQWQMSAHRHMYKLAEWCRLSETFADFLEGEEG